jgi:hypothetical protein
VPHQHPATGLIPPRNLIHRSTKYTSWAFGRTRPVWGFGAVSERQATRELIFTAFGAALESPKETGLVSPIPWPKQEEDVFQNSLQHPFNPSQIFLPRRRNPRPKHRTLNLHINLIKRIHNRLDPILINLRKELLDRLFRLRRCRVRSNGRAGSSRVRNRWLGGGVEEEEFDIYYSISSVQIRGNEDEARGVELPPVMKQET